MAWLRRAYEAHPRRFALAEILFIFGVLVVHRWLVPFWHWGIYRLDLPFPEGLSGLFYSIWLEKKAIRGVLIGAMILVIALGVIARRSTFKELGIRIDNIWKSGRECMVVLGLGAAVVLTIVIVFREKFSFERYFELGEFWEDLTFGLLSGTFQQFILQSIFLLRALEAFRRKSLAVIASSLLFAGLHTPNVMLMALTFGFGVICSILFLRNRNIFTLGILHAMLQQTVRVLFISLLVPGMTYYGRGYYEYTLRVGPHRGDPHYLAEMEYSGGPLAANASQPLKIPVTVLNKSISGWNSAGRNIQTFISYHLLDEQGMMVSFTNVLTPFAGVVEPGESETVEVTVNTPAEAGEYYVEINMLKRPTSSPEIQDWFKSRGSKTVRIPLSVRQAQDTAPKGGG